MVWKRLDVLKVVSKMPKHTPVMYKINIIEAQALCYLWTWIRNKSYSDPWKLGVRIFSTGAAHRYLKRYTLVRLEEEQVKKILGMLWEMCRITKLEGTKVPDYAKNDLCFHADKFDGDWWAVTGTDI